MIESLQRENRKPRLVGAFIRKKREALGLSQRALGQKFSPVVTTQFISNVERGVTPLPPSHVPTLANALKVSTEELMGVLEREYAAKLSGKLGHEDAVGNGLDERRMVNVDSTDYGFMSKLYEAYRQADNEHRTAFAELCQRMLNI